MTAPHVSFDLARQDAGLSQHDLWVRYFALGGMTPARPCGSSTVSGHHPFIDSHAPVAARRNSPLGELRAERDGHRLRIACVLLLHPPPARL